MMCDLFGYDPEGNGTADLLFVDRSRVQGSLPVWDGARYEAGYRLGLLPASWSGPDTHFGHGDFDGNGRSDLVIYNRNVGALQVWMNGSSVGARDLGLVGGFAVGDFNGDGISDLVVTNLSTGVASLWRSGDPQQATLIGTLPGTIVEAGDFDGDGHSDLLVAKDDANHNWSDMKVLPGLSLDSARYIGHAPIGEHIYVGDFNGDARSDLLFVMNYKGIYRLGEYPELGAVDIWFSGDFRTAQHVINLPNFFASRLSWGATALVGDFNGDGKSDFVVQQVGTSDLLQWDGGSLATSRVIGVVSGAYGLMDRYG